ncbi:type II toxin-antitoxin system RelE/ParE family toxin [Granulicella cerasi]|uniref:Type II toxin-antitoxin system RelE/ParE family toxin n=1 Tax=Granulicella cerasi TaxID=741063 RepID=A0ABW1Z9N7_9BACT|nr:type II toxin-antitoxin system RelE/ParE family toxin [Granulicella cerasi]
MLRVFKSRDFSRFAKRTGVDDAMLLNAVEQIERGLVDADLGGGVYKQRVARPKQGKSGGFRTILLMRVGELILFVDGFAKNERANISRTELEAFRAIAKGLLYDDAKLQAAIERKLLMEVKR